MVASMIHGFEDVMMAVDAEEGADEEREACPEPSFRVMPGNFASGAIALNSA